jgi:hypothetical protein
MTMNELFVSSLKQNLDMIKMHLADMSDADLMVRPVPGANHANWQMGHLIVSEVHMVTSNGGKSVELPAGFADRYNKEASKIDDASKFATKADLIAQFERVRAASVTWAQSLTPQQFDAPSSFPQFCPTVAHLVNILVGHALMHGGQIQVLRRKLGKPILF